MFVFVNNHSGVFQRHDGDEKNKEYQAYCRNAFDKKKYDRVFENKTERSVYSGEKLLRDFSDAKRRETDKSRKIVVMHFWKIVGEFDGKISCRKLHFRICIFRNFYKMERTRETVRNVCFMHFREIYSRRFHKNFRRLGDHSGVYVGNKLIFIDVGRVESFS